MDAQQHAPSSMTNAAQSTTVEPGICQLQTLNTACMCDAHQLAVHRTAARMRPFRPKQDPTRSANKFSQPPWQTRSHQTPPQQVTNTAMPTTAAAEALPPLRMPAAPCTHHCLSLLQAAAARGVPEHTITQGRPCSAGLSCTLTDMPSLLPPVKQAFLLLPAPP
jgi:hypothetical protein